MNTIEIRNVTKVYGSKNLEALQQTSIDVRENEFLSIIGPSGCGKTTLLKMVADLLKPTSGEVRVQGGDAKTARVARKVGLFFQDSVLLPWRTVLSNTLLPFQIDGSFEGRKKDELTKKALKMLEKVGLLEFKDSLPKELSGGMRQRAALARGLVYDPDILLMDEPFASLDELTRTEMNFELLRIWENDKKTVIFVTHHIPEAVFLSDRVIVMSPRPGRILTEEVIDLPRPRTSQIRDERLYGSIISRLRKWLLPDLHGAKAQVT